MFKLAQNKQFLPAQSEAESPCQKLDEWLAKNPEDYQYEFELEREAPRISCVLPHLILNGLLPYGEYLINIDW